jgi:cytochrome c
MLKTKLSMPLAGALLLFTSMNAVANETLAQKYNCLACHAVANKIVGPGFKEVAAKYKGDASAAANLAKKVKAGGGGTWGAIPMPPNAAVSDADIEILVKWILAL